MCPVQAGKTQNNVVGIFNPILKSGIFTVIANHFPSCKYRSMWYSIVKCLNRGKVL